MTRHKGEAHLCSLLFRGDTERLGHAHLEEQDSHDGESFHCLALEGMREPGLGLSTERGGRPHPTPQAIP